MTRSSADSFRPRRLGANLAAFLFGLPMAAGVVYLIQEGPLHGLLERYISHPVEIVAVGLFCCALAGLLAKLLGQALERAALRSGVVPAWDGRAVPVAEAGKLLESLQRKPGWLRSSLVGRRVAAVLDFLRSRRSATELDDQLRALADNDAIALEASYALTRFITWATPILGFLGTVLGITQAIAGVTPEQLEKSLSTVTDGLALAFDATAVALALTMIMMFFSFVVERLEQGALLQVDAWVERELAHRFERVGGGGSDVVDLVRLNSKELLKTAEQLLARQTEAWARALDEIHQRQARGEAELHKASDELMHRQAALWSKVLEESSRRQAKLDADRAGAALQLMEQQAALWTRAAEQSNRRQANVETELQQRLTQAIGSALDGTLAAHAGRLATAEKQAAGQFNLVVEKLAVLGRAAEGMAGQAAVLARLQEGEQQLIRLQEALERNLATLADAGSFQQAVQSLTAAIHMLAAHSVSGPTGIVRRPKEAA